MKKTWYKWTWADGTVTVCKGYNKAEKAAMVRQHGNLLKVAVAY